MKNFFNKRCGYTVIDICGHDGHELRILKTTKKQHNYLISVFNKTEEENVNLFAIYNNGSSPSVFINSEWFSDPNEAIEKNMY